MTQTRTPGPGNARGTSAKTVAARKAWQQRKREATRDALCHAGLTLFSQHGYDTVTTGQVAAAAGVSPMTFFRYFPTKEDLVLSMLPSQEFIASLREVTAQPGSALQAARTIGLELIDGLGPEHLSDFVRLVRLIDATPALTVALRSWRPSWAVAIDDLLPAGTDELGRRLAARVILDYLIETLLWWARHTDPDHPDTDQLARDADTAIATIARTARRR